MLKLARSKRTHAVTDQMHLHFLIETRQTARKAIHLASLGITSLQVAGFVKVAVFSILMMLSDVVSSINHLSDVTSQLLRYLLDPINAYDHLPQLTGSVVSRASRAHICFVQLDESTRGSLGLSLPASDVKRVMPVASKQEVLVHGSPTVSMYHNYRDALRCVGVSSLWVHPVSKYLPSVLRMLIVHVPKRTQNAKTEKQMISQQIVKFNH
jgi:hypothetical protein